MIEELVHIFSEEEFLGAIETVIMPFMEANVKESFFESYDKTKIHYYYALHPQEKASIVISHGFCEFFGKYHELFYYFYQLGYSVFFLEHRGHGFSGRFVQEYDHVYVKSYDEYVGDLKVFTDDIVSNRSLTKKYILFAHSMGGAIGTLFMEEYPQYFSLAILSSPLMEMNLGKYKKWQVNLMMVLAKILGWDKKLVPGQRRFDGLNVFPTSSALSKARYDYVFKQRLTIDEYTTYGGTYAWTRASIKAMAKLQKNTSKVTIPVLLLQAGKDTMVNPCGQQKFLSAVPTAEAKMFPMSKHEIFNATDEIRVEYYDAIVSFLQSHKI